MDPDARVYAELRPSVLRELRRRMRAHGLHFAELDLEGFYNEAFYVLYGLREQVASPGGFLLVAAWRLALRAARKEHWLHDPREFEEIAERPAEAELSERVDHRRLLAHFNATRRQRATAAADERLLSGLTGRESDAVELCVLGGMPRARAAERLGVSAKRMDKVMDSAHRSLRAFREDFETGRLCYVLRGILRDYRSGALERSSWQHEMARTHLAQCPACRIDAAGGSRAVSRHIQA